MTENKSSWLKRNISSIIWLSVFAIAAFGGWLTYPQWQPQFEQFVAFIQNRDLTDGEAEPDATDAPEVPDTLTLSSAAWNNIGLVTGVVKASDFFKSESVPAIVVERPGRSQIEIPAPMTGIVTRVYPQEREAIVPGQPLFDLRLTHEDVVSAQSDFLTRLQNLDVIQKELTRLQNISEGVIPGKRIIEQTYKLDEARASIAAFRQSLLLHGMSEEQVADIEETRIVLRQVTVVSPPFATNEDGQDSQQQYHVQLIAANRGESVAAGDLLGVIANHGLLNVEGKAFEDDADQLLKAARLGHSVEVVPVAKTNQSDRVLNLSVQSVADQIDEQSRALKFYLLLPNQLLPSNPLTPEKFVAWRYRPGQRMEVKIPTTELMKNKIVLPPDAVVIEGPNAFVFEQNGNDFDRIDVQVLYRDKDNVVLENDGQLIGGSIAMNGAYQMHLALKNMAGGAVDPHAGHTH